MKKSLIALAAVAVSGAAMAQSSVTLYGVADVVIHKDKGASARMTSGGVSTSRWGIKGSEDLGGGLKANFNFEQGLNLTDGSIKGNGFGRQAFVGFSGGFGEVKLGKAWNAFDDIAGAASPVFDAAVLTPNNIAPTYAGYVGNPNSGVYYASPSFGGFSAAISSSFKDAAQADLRVTAFNVKYENGPVMVAVGQERQKTIDTVQLTRVVGSYDFGMAKLLASYGTVKEGANDGTDDFTIGVDVPLAANIVLSTGFTQVRPDVGDNANSFALAVAYNLSKRTTVYTGFRKDNDAAVNSFGGVESRFGVGVKHTF
ncbi:MAG: porin [Hydrogenophaga sp.]|nr:porin [Hydrogenophaga sp.]